MTTPTAIEELVRNSGNSFHAKVARWLSDDGWHVVVSPYYMDQTQNKAREIDLVAEKLWPISDTWGKPLTNLCVRLYVECKYVPTPTVFWFTDKDLGAALDLTCKDGVFRRENFYTEKHHRKLPRQVDSSKVEDVAFSSASMGVIPPRLS